MSATGSDPGDALTTAASTLAVASDAVTRTVHESEPIFGRTVTTASTVPAVPSVVPRLARSSIVEPRRRASLEIAAATAEATEAAPAGVPSVGADPAVRLRRMSIAAQQALTALEAGADRDERAAVRSSVAGLAEAQRQLDAVEAAVREQAYRHRGAGGGCCGGGGRDVEEG